MADTLCGPANPLQQFKSQTQLDRTLQQDRLTSRLSPSHGFRSADPNTGLLDPEFEAFQNGLSPQDLPTYYPTYQQPPQQPAFAGPSQAQSSWASDFQHMSIASQQRPQQAPANTASASSAWSQGFKEQYSQFGPRQQSSAPSPLAFQQRARYGGLQSNFARPAYASGMTQTKGKEAVVDQFDEAAFERAFEQANESIAKEAEQVESADLVQLYEDEVAAARSDLLQNKQLESQQQNQVQQQREDDDALAATAQDLLSKVENNQTDKFRNSQFLSLMRKLRDREVKVEGDQMVTTATSEPVSITPPSLSSGSLPLQDSGYVSTAETSAVPMPNDHYTHFDTHVCTTPGCRANHEYDHWESPV